MPVKKELGQHWLTDRVILNEIAEAAGIEHKDTVLEIGPGLGTLTSELLKRAWKVVAVEFDAALAAKLPGQFPGKNLTVAHADIISYDLSQLQPAYVVVANVPYYITSKIVQKLMAAPNKPRIAVLLVQKEVAHRIAAVPGDMSVLAISAQVYAEASVGIEVPRAYFTPPPNVDSQVIILRTRNAPLVDAADEKVFFQLVKAGFSAKRKKLRSSIAGGLSITKQDAELLLRKANLSPDDRAEDLSIADWKRLLAVWQ